MTTDCGHPVDFTVRSADRELHVCAAHLAWAAILGFSGLLMWNETRRVTVAPEEP